ncbi:hypothetical protein KMW28_14765 [Flammeovirga yaeyamensis]|uniref:J domain-containing protein n=1 Tax=Flammeovirga yaeyamensis TaxID=367791 RepID=A0AAX1N018_9BACT|nr:hypothetical protein [Flammeovirga yaeyamensis]MBB3700145.1 hypothetical protein [Flammeovirga yaeyamensis]NMF37225.1 hypothetical protein [Flammeovirga yaeyamensis]QWG00914.1 hypothetical protein KMW28_14765 [Flammeovirga yaeyamensis]
MKEDKLIVFDKIIHRKPKKNPKTPTDKLTKLWQEVEKKNRRNKRLYNDFKSLLKEYNQFVSTSHKTYIEQIKSTLEHLFFIKKTTTLSNKQFEIYQLITQNLMMSALSSPYVYETNVHRLIPEYYQSIESNQHSRSKSQLMKELKQSILYELKFRSRSIDNIEDYITAQDWEYLIENPDKVDAFYEKKIAPILIEKEKNKAIKRHKEEEKSVTKRTTIYIDSLNKIYKALAKKLHPDLVQDDNVKQDRHLKMSEIIKAKNNNDLFTLIVFYQKYVADAINIGQHEIEHILESLQSKSDTLDREKEEFLHSKLEQYVFSNYTGLHGNGIRKHSLAMKEKFQKSTYQLRQLKDKTSSDHELKQYLQTLM